MLWGRSRSSSLRFGVQAHIDAHSTHPQRGHASSPAHGGQENWVPSDPGKGKPRRRRRMRRRRKSSSGEQRPGSSHQQPGGPHRQAEGPGKEECETSRSRCFIKCINTHFFKMICGFIAASSPPTPTRTPAHLYRHRERKKKKKAGGIYSGLGTTAAHPPTASEHTWLFCRV